MAAFIGLKIAFENGTELKVKTFGELAEKMTAENYVKTRRNSNTYNKYTYLGHYLSLSLCVCRRWIIGLVLVIVLVEYSIINLIYFLEEGNCKKR